MEEMEDNWYEIEDSTSIIFDSSCYSEQKTVSNPSIKVTMTAAECIKPTEEDDLPNMDIDI